MHYSSKRAIFPGTIRGSPPRLSHFSVALVVIDCCVNRLEYILTRFPRRIFEVRRHGGRRVTR